MKICRKKEFGPVTAYQLGYSPIGSPLMSVYMYVVDTVVIDTAQRHLRAEVIGMLKDHAIERILLTHYHEDHSGNAAEIHRLFSVEVLGHPLTAEKMNGRLNILPYQHLVWGKAGQVPVTPLPDCIDTGRYRFMPVHTPGHSKDHTVYLETRNGWLFSGDLYLGDRIKYFRSDEKFRDQMDSLKTVLTLDFNALFCGHNPISEDGKARLAAKLSFLEDFFGRVTDMNQKGMTESEIIARLDLKQDRLVKWVTLGNACFANMVKSVLTI
ncbi:MAG: MBL fold metallo-hydrolase [Deltaproteobacteria bacterium]|nr:MBL fold metallo-hydrolase [Deltaproteobacteria bacterium]